MTDSSRGRDEPVDFGFETVGRAEKTRRVRAVFDSVARRYDVMNDLMSFGLHRLWKRIAVAAAGVRPGDEVLDLAGGTGDLTRRFVRAVGTRGHVVLADINGEMLHVGRDRLLDDGCVNNISVVQANAESLPFADKRFDRVVIAFGLRNVTDKESALGEMYRVLRPGGRAFVLEFSQLRIPMLSRAYDAFSFQVLPRLGQWVARDADSYRYLAESIRRHPNQEMLAAMMQTVGFEHCRFRNMAGGIVALHDGLRL